MASRVFLGWDGLFCQRAVAWLLERRELLPGALLVVPTAESGRRLREALAEAAGGILGPQVITPGGLLRVVDEAADTAPEWAERAAWMETLEAVEDWSPYAAVFPEPPGEGDGWAAGLAAELAALRAELQENGHTLASAARVLAGSPEAERWQALSALEPPVERLLASWGFVSRSRRLASGLALGHLPETVILCGISSLPRITANALACQRPTFISLIAAPESEAEAFSDTGLPSDAWRERVLPLPCEPWGAVHLTANPRHQATAAVARLAAAGTPSNETTLIAADGATGPELVTALARAGWTAFHPAGAPPGDTIRAFLHLWRAWLNEPTLAAAADLLTQPAVSALVDGARADLALGLAELRGDWMARHPDELERRLKNARFRSEEKRSRAEAAIAAVRTLGEWRGRFEKEPFPRAVAGLLAALGDEGEGSGYFAWLEQAAPVIDRLRHRPAVHWLDLMLETVPAAQPVPPDDRALDIQGWLEALHESGQHLVLCGMNDGSVPNRSSGSPWLSETARKTLGLTTEADGAARDAFLFQALLESRRNGGRVDVFCSKSGTGGEPLMPSRLLLAAPRDELPARVGLLFREVVPPDAGLRRETDWQWQPPPTPPLQRISVTALKDYLACPFRFYLKHLAGLSDPETERLEWNHRDFGTAAHAILERWGEDHEAREFSKTEALADWLSAELDRLVGAWFGSRPPLAVRIQAESLRQRLTWFARVQACQRAEGWQVVDVERKVEIPVGDTLLVAKIDRIDRHSGTGEMRVIDYKTGNIRRGVAGEHRTKTTARTTLPPHLSADSPVIFQDPESGKNSYRWTNLQLPLYAHALVARGEALPRPAYIGLGSTAGDVKLDEWSDFGHAEMEAAVACAGLLADMIRRSVFWPPAPRVDHDDFEILAAGSTLEENFTPPPPFP